MKKCNFCNKIIKTIPYRCKFCGLLFCSDHRIPENHFCSYDLKNIEESLLYEDAFLNPKLTIAKIYQLVNKKKLTKKEATKLLNFFIEQSEDIEERINSIIAFQLLKLNGKEAYKILEKCAISDINSKVRKTAINVLRKLFPDKEKKISKLRTYQSRLKE